MKTTNYLLVTAAAAATFTFAAPTKATDALLSPRARGNQIKTTDEPTEGTTVCCGALTGNARMREHLASIQSAPGTAEDQCDYNTFNTFALVRPRQADMFPGTQYEMAPDYQVAPEYQTSPNYQTPPSAPPPYNQPPPGYTVPRSQ